MPTRPFRPEHVRGAVAVFRGDRNLFVVHTCCSLIVLMVITPCLAGGQTPRKNGDERQTASSDPEGIAREALRRSIGTKLSWCCEAPHASRRTKATLLSPIELPSAPRQISDITGGVSADVRTARDKNLRGVDRN